MGALDKIIRANLAHLEELLGHSTVPVGPAAHEEARRAVSMGVAPSWAQAQAKGLPLDPVSIENRANALGFTNRAFHGTHRFPFDEMDEGDRQFSEDPTDYDFHSLEGRRIVPEDPDTTVSRYLGAHISRGPKIAQYFTGYKRSPYTAVLNPMTQEYEPIGGVAYQHIAMPGGRIIPLRFRGSQYELPQKWLFSDSVNRRMLPDERPDLNKPIFDDLAVDIDAATHALLADPEFARSTAHGEGTPSFDKLRQLSDRGNEYDMRRFVQARHNDLNPLMMSPGEEDPDYLDPNTLQSIMDIYRGNLLGRGHSVIRYHNTMENETMGAPSADSYIVLDPSRVRGPSAIYDPDLSHLGGLSYFEGGEV